MVALPLTGVFVVATLVQIYLPVLQVGTVSCHEPPVALEDDVDR